MIEPTRRCLWHGLNNIHMNLPLSRTGIKFSFDSIAWAGASITSLYLTEIVRQSDPIFMNLLNEVRLGKCSPQTSAILAAAHVSVKQIPNDNILPTKLYCTNANVDEENMARLRALPGQQYDLVAIDSWQSEPSNSDQRQQVLYTYLTLT